MASNNPLGRPSSFMSILVQLISDHPDVISFDGDGILCIPSPPDLEKLLPNYYRTAKLASFYRQLNNFGYHRNGGRSGPRPPDSQGLKYHKVVGEATTPTLRPSTTETKRSAAPKQIYDPSVERKKPQSSRKCSRTPTPPVDGIELPTEASLASNPLVAALIAKARADERATKAKALAKERAAYAEALAKERAAHAVALAKERAAHANERAA
jgi:hypothetical protein